MYIIGYLNIVFKDDKTARIRAKGEALIVPTAF